MSDGRCETKHYGSIMLHYRILTCSWARFAQESHDRTSEIGGKSAILYIYAQICSNRVLIAPSVLAFEESARKILRKPWRAYLFPGSLSVRIVVSEKKKKESNVYIDDRISCMSSLPGLQEEWDEHLVYMHMFHSLLQFNYMKKKKKK